MNEKTKKYISFIIPAHNAENYLRRCVKSITENAINNRYLDKIEIIIIENGSNDNTLEEAKMIQKIDNRVQVYSSLKGVSKARNLGLKVSKGEYIVFVDSDDRLELTSINLMIKNIYSDKADLWLYGHTAGRNIKSVSKKNEKQVYYEKNILEARRKMIKDPTRYMQVWGKVFRRDIIDRYHIRFNEKMKLSEDSDFTLKYISNCKKIIFMPDIIYNYSLNMESTMRTYDGSKVEQYIEAMEETSKYVKDRNFIDQNSFEKYILMHFNIAMVREVFAKQNSNSMRNKINQMLEVVYNPIFYKAFAHTKLRECKSVRMLPILFIKLHMNYMAALIYTVRAELNVKNER